MKKHMTIVMTALFLVQGIFISFAARADAASIAVDNLVGGYGRQMTGTSNNQMLAPSPSAPFATQYGQVQNSLKNTNSTMLTPVSPDAEGRQTINPSGTDLGQTAITSLLTSSGSKNLTYQQTLNKALYPPSISGLFGAAAAVYTDTAATLPNYDIKSLLSPIGYQNQQAAQTALNYIQLLAQPSISANIDTLRGYNSNNFLPYIMAVRGYVAMQSIGINNLYQSFADRVPMKDLGKTAGMPNNNASALEVEDFAAKKRVTNSDWYKAMETATPATIQRETLYVLAEMRLEMYKNCLALERLILTNSALLLQTNTSSVTMPLQQLQSRVTPPPTK